jgi:tetratricopeptide (TPR) repeat protein
MLIGAGKYNVDSAVENLQKDRICWIVSSWDLEGDDFLSCIETSLSEGRRVWYRLSTLGYKSQEKFGEFLDREYGFSIIDLCNLLTNKDDAILILDDAPCEILESGKSGVEELASLAQTILEYCHKLKIIIRSTSKVEKSELPPIILKAMDEADFSQYLLLHPDGKNAPTSGVRTEDLFKITKGEPTALKRTLNQLRFSQAEDINFENSTDAAANARASIIDAPLSLKTIIDGLQLDSESRCYQLLHCLTVFPYGEDMSNIRNFNPDVPFFPVLAERLSNLGLVDAVQFPIFHNENLKSPKLVVAKRSVQEYILGAISQSELDDATNKAISLYFGRDWRLGRFKLNTEFKLDQSNHSSYSIQNAAVLLRRVVNDAIKSGDSRPLQNSLALLNFYISKLDKACQYRYVCDTCFNLIPKLEDLESSPVVQDIIYRYARGLRMLGDRTAAIEIFQKILDSDTIERNFKGRVLVELAFSYQDIGDKENALVTAKKILSMKERQASYFHAKTIAVSLSNEPTRLPKLRALEKRCRNKNFFIAANNIAVQLIAEFENESNRKDLYKTIASRARSDNDNYNFIKSTINFSRIAIKQSDKLTNKDIVNLIICYHYVCSQRMTTLFNQSHECLWSEFERLGETTNLVTLFKHSSLLFRLSADEAREKLYLERLINTDIPALQSALSLVSEPDKIYIINRMLRLGLATIKDSSQSSQFKVLKHD